MVDFGGNNPVFNEGSVLNVPPCRSFPTNTNRVGNPKSSRFGSSLFQFVVDFQVPALQVFNKKMGSGW